MEPSGSSTDPEDSIPPKELYAPIIEQEKARTAESRIDENTFIDKKSRRLFRRYQYFGHTVIQDVETGRINAGKFVRKVSKLEGKGRSKQLSDFRKATKDYAQALDFCDIQLRTEMNGRDFSAVPTRSEIETYMLLNFNEGFGKKVQGTYVPFPVFQLIALWADKRHKLEVLVLLANINEKAYVAKLAHPDIETDAYYELHRLNEQLERETADLKAKIKEKDEVIKMKEELIRISNTPINRIISNESIYASPVGLHSFTLRCHRQPIHEDAVTPTRLQSIDVNNAYDVKRLAMEILMKEGLVFSVDGKRQISRDNLDIVFQILERIAKNESFEVSLQSKREAFLRTEIDRLHSLIQTGTVIGFIYEKNYILEHSELIPWEVVPKHILNYYHEVVKDTGIDAVELDGERFKTIVQIKHHSNNYLRDAEVRGFLLKCQEQRYTSVRKRLIIHNCRLSKTMRRTIDELGIELIEINDESIE